LSKAAAGLLASKTPWEHRAAQAIRNRRDVRVIRERTDVVVRYLLDRPLKGDPSLEQALNTMGLAGDDARAQAREMLDRALFGGHPSPEMLLGIKAAAGPERIRQQYKRLVQLYHPDRSADVDEAVGNERVQRLRKAYESLMERATAPPEPAAAAPLGRPSARSAPSGVRMDPRHQKRDWPESRRGVRIPATRVPKAPSRSLLRISRWIKIGGAIAGLYVAFVVFSALKNPEVPAVAENAVAPGPLVSYPAVGELVDNFEAAHARGDTDAVMQLFATSLSVNALQDRDAIRGEFHRQFEARLDEPKHIRGLAFRPGVARKIGDNELIIEGVADASHGDVRIASPFKMLITWIDGQPIIRHLEHQLPL